MMQDRYRYFPRPPEARRQTHRFTVGEVVEANRRAIAGGRLAVAAGEKVNHYLTDSGRGCAVGVALPSPVLEAIAHDWLNHARVKDIWMLCPDNQTAIDLIQMAYDTWVLQLDDVLPDLQWWVDLADHYGLDRRGRRVLTTLPLPRSGFQSMTPERYMAILDKIAAWDRSL